ncbi:MAG: HepT-like ribonuclease domain-containing protein [Bacteroidota bacterium]
MPRKLLLYLDDILTAIHQIQTETQSMDFETFKANQTVINSVMWGFQVIGEATKAIPNEKTEIWKEIKVSEVIGFRNILVHYYYGIQLVRVWDTIQESLPILKTYIELMIAEEG